MHSISPDWPAPAHVIALTTLRTGGARREPYASLNLGDHVGDDPGAVAANRAALSRKLPPGTTLNWLAQVHGNCVVRAAEAASVVADASWTCESRTACVVMTADCLPVLFCARDGSVVAAAHAGWRGLLAGVLENTVAAMGVAPAELLAWLGPAIGPAAFEVGPEVRSAFLDAAGSGFDSHTRRCFVPSVRRPGHYLADLYGLARLRLSALGRIRLFGGDYCTFAAPERFFSHRRDGQTGRMASLILLGPQ